MKIKVLGYEVFRKLEVLFKPGINQVTGETNTGKSSLMRMIYEFAKNSITEGEINITMKKMFVQIDDDCFERTKIKKSYKIRGKNYNTPGRGHFKALEFLKIGEVNFQHQQTSPFLIGYSPGEKYKVIVGDKEDKYVDALDDMKNECDKLSSKKKNYVNFLNNKENQLEKIEDELMSFDYDTLLKLKDIITKCNEMRSKLQKALDLKNKLDILNQKTENIYVIDKNVIQQLHILSEKSKKLKELKKLSNKQDILNKKIEKIKEIDRGHIEKIKILQKQSKALKISQKMKKILDASIEIRDKNFNLKILHELIEKKNRLIEIKENKKILKIKWDKYQTQKRNVKKAYDDLQAFKAKLGACPICGGDLEGDNCV